MLRHLFERKPDPSDIVFAEAQSLLDDGLDLEVVLGLFPDDAGWLRAELSVAADIAEAANAQAPSYYFEASLKSKFVAAGRVAAQPVAPAPATPFRTAVASMGVLAGAGIVGVLTLGFVTAGNSVPGDWNYSFKIANERLQYALSNGDDRVDIQLHQAEQRVYEIRTLTRNGKVDASDIDHLQRELRALADLAQQQQFDAVQKERVIGLAGTTRVVLDDALTTKPALDPSVTAAAAAVDNAVTALAPAPVKQLPPAPTATATSTATGTATATATSTATASTTATATAETPAPSPSPTATASTPTPSATPAPTGTPSPAATPSPSPSPTAAH